MRHVSYLAVLLTLMATFAALAGDGVMTEIASARQACAKALHAGGENWLGWQRGDPGYDAFHYWRADGKKPAILSIARQLGEMAREEINYCFRADGKLVFIQTLTSAGNAAEGRDHGRPLSREGKIYLGPDGTVLKVTGVILDDRQRPHALGNAQWIVPAICEELPLYATTEEVERTLTAELGDAYGARPAFKPAALDWCGKAVMP